MAETELMKQKRLSTGKLRNAIDPSVFSFETTEDLEPLRRTIDQERVLESMRVALGIEDSGYNVYACGQVGTGRNTTVKSLIEERAKDRPTPPDWIYVHNFEDQDRPRSFSLPAGKGRELAEDMDEFIEDCRRDIAESFSEEEFEKKRSEELQDIQQRRDELLRDLKEKAKELDHQLQISPAGIAAVPLVDGEPVSQEEFEELAEEKKEELREKGEKVQELTSETISKVRNLEKEAKERSQEMVREVGLFVVGHLIDELKEKYQEFDEVVEFLECVKDDVVDNVDLFRQMEDEQQIPGWLQPLAENRFNRYRANVVVNNADAEGAPVIDERNPNYYNLFGQLEYRAQLGGMTTDFTLIKAGAYQRASGGYLVLQIIDVLRNPFSWEGLKRAIRTGEVKIENMWERYRPTPTSTLHPQPIPAKVKVVLVGNPVLYHLLYALDEEFRRLFKIKADFDTEMERSDENIQRYAAFVSAQCCDRGAPAFDPSAAARLTEYGVRLSGRRDKLSTEFLRICDLISESIFCAKEADAEVVSGEHVQQAIDGARYRSRMIADKVQERISDGQILIDTEGEVRGQVNGLAVYDLGDFRFGKPSRITCVSAVGRSGVVNIERESKMSGSIHDKGVLILTGYMSWLFGQDKPLSLSARICLEQTYGGVEGDSASCAELYTLLSSLADLPIRQDLAVTGSTNQWGEVQPVGGINEKIEGWFEVCRDRGLTGEQGVLVPARNAVDLMLNKEVIAAVDEGKFHVYAVETVSEGIEILTGVEAGERGEDGKWPEDSVYGLVDSKLRQFAETMKEFGRPPLPEKAEEEESGA